MERNVRLLVCYDGTGFHGWQHQPGLRTVQGVLRDQIQRVARHPVGLNGSGRTDSGVHAYGQVANFRTDCAMSAEKLRYAIGSRLAPDVTIREAMDVNEGFHASRGAISKSYRYRLFNARHRPVAPETLRYVRHVRDVLDVDKMREAAARFIGEKDFAGVANKGVERETTVREVFRCDVERRFEEIRIDVEGSGFLYNQVRIMVGTLIEIGRGRWVPERVTEILESKDRSNAGPTAPPQGLSLMWVRYPASLLRPS